MKPVPSHMRARLCRVRCSSAFSLVEVTLAVAVTATVAMTLLGLLPAGLDGMRQSANTAAHARILQTLAGQAQMNTWQEITSPGFASRTYAFDYQGGELESLESAQVTYLARGRVQDAPPLPGSTVTNPRLRLLRIEVVTGSSPADFGTPRCNTYATQIAQMDETP